MAQAFFNPSAYAAGDFATEAAADFTVQALDTVNWNAAIVDLGGGVKVARATRTGSGNAAVLLVAHNFATTGDIEVYAEFTLGTTWAANFFAGPALINVADNQAYACRFTIDPGPDSFRMGQVNASGSATGTTIGGTVSKTNPAAGTVIAVRLGRYNTSTTQALRAKLWLPGSESEPGAWMWDGTNSGLSNIRPGWYGFNGGDNPYNFQCLGIGTGSDAAPTTAPGNGSANLLAGKFGGPFRGKFG